MLRMTMDTDSHLSHREQMISSLSVITYRKKRAAEQASSGFEALLRPRDRKTVKRISSLLALKEVLDTAGAGVSVQRVPGGISFEIRTAGHPSEDSAQGRHQKGVRKPRHIGRVPDFRSGTIALWRAPSP